MLLRRAALGRLTRADLMAALVAELRLGSDALERVDAERCRRAQVNRLRLLDAMAKTLAPSPASGLACRVCIVWPAHETRDPGEAVRLEEATAPVVARAEGGR